MDEPGSRPARSYTSITWRRCFGVIAFGIASAFAGSGATTLYLRHTTRDVRWQEALATLRNERAHEEARLAGLVHLTRVTEQLCDAAHVVARSDKPSALRVGAQLALQRIREAAQP